MNNLKLVDFNSNFLSTLHVISLCDKHSYYIGTNEYTIKVYLQMISNHYKYVIQL